MKTFLQFFYLSNRQIAFLVSLSKKTSTIPGVGKLFSILLDNFLSFAYGIDVSSRSIDVAELVIGHSHGVVLGGNGIRCTGKLHVMSGVVFGRRANWPEGKDPEPFFDLEGDVTVGANSVILGPIKIVGPTTIGALTLVSKDILEPGVYVGAPARRLEPRSE